MVEVSDLKITHVILFVIVAFLLYHLMGGCGCSIDGFNVGGQDKCYDKNRMKCMLDSDCKFYDGTCMPICMYEPDPIHPTHQWIGKICHNDGLCKEDGDKNLCECTSGWTGPTCEIEIPICFDGEVCHNGGSCHEKESGIHECRCLDTWTGPHCKIKTPPQPHHPAPHCPLALPNEDITPWNKNKKACECPEGMTKEKDGDKNLWRCRKK